MDGAMSYVACCVDQIDAANSKKVTLTGANAFNPIFPKLAQQYGASLYPFFLDGVVADPELMLPDNIHPNAQGVAKVVDGLAPIVEKALQRPQSKVY